MNKERMTPEIRFAGFIDDWEQHKLGNVVDILDGDRGKNYPSGNEFYENEHTLFLNASNVTKNGFSFKNNQFISEQKSNSLGNGKLKIDDIVLTSRGSLGHIAWYDSTIHKKISNARINSGMLLLRSTSKVTPSYITQYLKSPLGKKQIDFLSFGSAQPQLTKKDIVNYRIKIPSNMEQKIIGEFFLDFDNTIALQQQLLSDYRQLKKALLQQLFPQKGETVPKVSLKKHDILWDQKYIGDIFKKIESGNRLPKTMLKQGTVPYIIAKTTDNGVFMRIDKDSKDYHENEMKFFPAGSITFSIDNPEAIFYQDEPFFTSNIMRVLYNPLINNFHSIFIVESMKKLTRNYNWTSKFSGPVVMNSMISLPIESTEEINWDEVAKIGRILGSVDDCITNIQKKIEAYQELKKALLQRMFV